MAVSRGNFNRPAQLSPVRVVSTSNISGTYSNGPVNDGVGSQLATSSNTLTIDGVVIVQFDSVLLAGQTASSQNGIYVHNGFNSSGNVVLQRRDDMQSRGQFIPGFFIPVAAGTAFAGSLWTLVEPQAINIGTDAVSLIQTSVTDIALPTIANHFAVFTNAAGALGEDVATAINGGNIQAGLDATAGTLTSFPSTTASGKLVVAAVNNSGGNFNTTISNAASVGQSQVVSIPDGGSATSNFIISNSSGTQTIATGSLALTVGNVTATAGNLQAGSSGHAGTVASFPGTAGNGELILAGVNAGGAFNTTISNSAMLQSSVISIPDPGATTAQFVLSQSIAPTNNVAFTKVITAGFAALAAAGKVNVQVHTSATCQFAVLDVKVFKSTGLSGGGGNRLLSLTDGTIVFNDTGITAALLGTPIFTLWGGTGNPITASGVASVSTAGADIFLQYTGGAADYAAGSVIVAVTLVQVTA